MKRGRIPYTQSELSNLPMNRHKPPRARPVSANPKMQVDLESNKSAQIYANDLDHPSPLWQHYSLWIKRPALSVYQTLRVIIPALSIWIVLSIGKIAVEPTLLNVLIHGGLLSLFWHMSLSYIFDHSEEGPALWFSWSWASLFCFEFHFSIYTAQSLCTRLIKKMRTGDDVSPLTLLVRLS